MQPAADRLKANSYESGQRKVIPAVLVYVRSQGRILMIHRNAEGKEWNSATRTGDYHSGKWNGLGGKCEADESFLETAQRELREESGFDLPLSAFKPLGTLQFPNFKPHRQEDWVVAVFTADIAGADLESRSSDEGQLHWVPEQDLLSLNLWPGDRHFISHVVERQPFIGTIWYQGPDVTRFWIQPIC